MEIPALPLLLLVNTERRMRTPLPFVVMVIVILAQVSGMIVTKAALSRGINKYVIIVYSNILSLIILLPCSLLFHRSIHFPLDSSFLYRFLLLALVGCVSQISGYVGMDYGSPTLGSAMLNLIPAFTFILTVIFRMEKLEWRSRSSQVKTLGTIISISGAFVVTFYRGPMVIRTQSLPVPTHPLLSLPQFKWIIGALLLATEAFMLSAWYILQTIKMFPAILTVMFYLSIFTTIISAVYSSVLVQETSAWKLRLDIGLFAVFFSALVSILKCSLCAWCLYMVGPLYVSMFKPLGIIFAVAMGVLFLGDGLCLGSMVGAVIIVGGFYAVMWGKANEEEDNGLGKVPLLQKGKEDASSSV